MPHRPQVWHHRSIRDNGVTTQKTVSMPTHCYNQSEMKAIMNQDRPLLLIQKTTENRRNKMSTTRVIPEIQTTESVTALTMSHQLHWLRQHRNGRAVAEWYPLLEGVPVERRKTRWQRTMPPDRLNDRKHSCHLYCGKKSPGRVLNWHRLLQNGDKQQMTDWTVPMSKLLLLPPPLQRRRRRR